jgi:hypothetical protein
MLARSTRTSTARVARWRTAKECQLDLFADRTSAATMRANQLRLWFASMAYVLMEALRRIALKTTTLANATCGSIRLKLLKRCARARERAPRQDRHGLRPPLPARVGACLRRHQRCRALTRPRQRADLIRSSNTAHPAVTVSSFTQSQKSDPSRIATPPHATASKILCTPTFGEKSGLVS